MRSAGNDIVALNAIDIQRTRDARFYSKFIIDAELAIYQPTESLPFELFVWLLWSVKESAYKYLQRHDAGMVFSPAKLVVQQINIPPDFILTPFTGIYWDSEHPNNSFITGTISCGKQQLHFRTKIHPEFIATAVNIDEHFENVYWGVQLIENTDHRHQSKEVKDFALIKLRSVLGTLELQIVKSEIGYPVVLDGGTPLEVAISFAHHDKWVGYSFAK